MKNAKKLLALALAGTMMFSFAGCGSSASGDSGATADNSTTDNTAASDTTADKDTLVVGLDDTFAPMGFRDENGDLVGFDIDLANAVGEELGMKVEFKPIDWDAKEIELESGTIDCVWNGMSVTPERKESMALTDKYLNNKIVLMTLRSVFSREGISAEGSATMEAFTGTAKHPEEVQ